MTTSAAPGHHALGCHLPGLTGDSVSAILSCDFENANKAKYYVHTAQLQLVI